MSAAGAFDALCVQLTAQHQQFLSDATQKVVEALKHENRRLAEENRSLRQSLSSQKNAQKQQVADQQFFAEPPAGMPLRLTPVGKPCQPDVPESAVIPGTVPANSTLAVPKADTSGHNVWSTMADDEVDRRRRRDTKRRLRHVLDIGAHEEFVSVDALANALRTRDTSANMSRHRVEVVVNELNRILVSASYALPDAAKRGLAPRPDQISFEALLEVINNPSLVDYARLDHRSDVSQVVLALRNPTVEELVESASKSITDGSAQRSEAPDSRAWERRLNVLVSIVVCVNMLSMAVAVDHSPSHFGWTLLETVCVAIFLAELVIKLYKMGAREFFSGESSTWNLTDTVVTAIAVVELVLGYVDMMLPGGLGAGYMMASAMRVAVMLRALRIVRIVRLVRLVESPMLRDLANMLVGFVIGIPSLFWVLLFFLIVLFMKGLFFRLMFGPSEGQALMDVCGLPDDITDYSDPVCKVHYMYGEEFFGTVPLSMFTTFRFMLGDYSTRGGKSLILAFSQDYGMKFDVMFVAWMIVVIFGLFNIITSIFVETTVAGLKHNDVKRKYAMQYQRQYVQRKLTEVLKRIQEMHFERKFLPNHKQEADFSNYIDGGFSEEEYMQIMEDDTIKRLLEDLDIDTMPLASLFHTFDGDDSGSVSVQELVEGIVKLRGDPQKSDIIGCWVSTRLLHGKLDQLRAMLEKRPGGEADTPRESGAGWT